MNSFYINQGNIKYLSMVLRGPLEDRVVYLSPTKKF